jgi:S-adenosylmethionine:tRNA ribosyltransferase-isomerase
LKTCEFDYHLPDEYIAQAPIEPRDHSRLLIYYRRSKSIIHTKFYNLPEFLTQGDVLVLNQTRVIHARLKGRKLPGKGKVEILLLKQIDDEFWEALVGGKKLDPGRLVQLDHGPQVEILQNLGGAKRLIRICDLDLGVLEKIGIVPLPPYIHQELDEPERYQTVYARDLGSAAAPTAGLHFTQRLLGQLLNKGVKLAYVTLHVGLDTFSPVTHLNPEDHTIHSEWRSVSTETAQIVNDARMHGNRVIAVGTTSVRTLESAVMGNYPDFIVPSEGSTRLFILPGYHFQIIDGMVTNFHLPKSTLIMMVSAFAGRGNILQIYELAMQYRYRFYSFGDAMLLL